MLILLSALGGAVSAESPEDLLRRSDIATAGPQAFRAVLRVTADQKPIELEVWRSGENRTLVRFLAPKERGKYLVRLDRRLWFLSPGAKNPVKLAPSYKLKGSASLDDLLGIRYSRDYEIMSFTESRTRPEPGGLRPAGQGQALSAGSYLVHRRRRAAAGCGRRETGQRAEFAEWDKTQRTRFSACLRDQLRQGSDEWSWWRWRNGCRRLFDSTAAAQADVRRAAPGQAASRRGQLASLLGSRRARG
jgi:hypothetical protein